MANKYLLAIDQGTTGSTVMVVDVSRPEVPRIVGRSTRDFSQHYPKPGWVEHDLIEIWSSVREAAKQAMASATVTAGFDRKHVIGVGITNQRETLCVFDRATGAPLTRAIVWQCKRSVDVCDRLKREGYAHLYTSKTGLVLDPYFTGTKITWVMDNLPDVAKALKSGKACLGTIDTYLTYQLSGFKTFATEASNASRTLAFNIRTGEWDPELLAPLKVPSASVLPEVRDSAGSFGVTKGLDFLPDGIPISGILGDQQAALAGQTCFDPGEAKCTYGTGAFLLMNIGAEPRASTNGLLTTVAWSLKGRRTYALEGSAFIAGAAVQFLRDQLGFVTSSADSEPMARPAIGAPEVYCVPALAGLGAPHWDPMARGAFFGLTRGTTREQLVRAALEGIAFQVHDLVRAMEQDSKAAMSVLRVDGGAAANDLLMQTQADLCGLPVDRPVNLETTAFGAALFAGLGVGLYRSLDDLRGARQTATMFDPDKSAKAVQHRDKQIEGWHRAVQAVRIFAGTVSVVD